MAAPTGSYREGVLKSAWKRCHWSGKGLEYNNGNNTAFSTLAGAKSRYLRLGPALSLPRRWSAEPRANVGHQVHYCGFSPYTMTHAVPTFKELPVFP